MYSKIFVGYINKVKCGLMSASMKWRHLIHLQLLSRAVPPLAVVAENEVSPQDEMSNPQVMKVNPVENHGLLENFVYFRAMCGVQSSPLVLSPNRGSRVVRYRGSCISCTHAQMDAPLTRTGRNG